MGYIVDFDELDSSFATAYTQCSNWITSLQAVQSAFTALNESVNMSGNGADNIRLYIEAVHYTIIGGIGAVMEAHWKNFLAYKSAYQKQVDTGLHAHINVDNIGTLHEHLGNQKTYARQIDNELGLALGQVSDIFRVSYADITVVDELYKDARDFLTQTADSISNLENAHVTADFENTDVLLQNLSRFLQEQLEQNRSYKESFSAEAISQSSSIRDLISSYDLVATELGNKEELYTAAFANEEERSVALQKEAEEAEERAKKAKIEKWIVTGLCVVGSAVVIIGSGGSATPLVVASVSAVSGAIISGNNNAMDQYVANGRVTDWRSVAGNSAIGGITGFITGYLGAAGSTAITNSLSTAGSTLIDSSSMLVRVTTNAAIGSTSQVVTGMASRGAGSFTETMIRSGGNVFESLDAAADSAFDLHSIAYDGIIGGVSGGIKGIKKPVQEIEPKTVEFERNGLSEEEYRRQLALQEEGMNDLTVQEYLDNRAEFNAKGRSSAGSAAQREAREIALADKIDELQLQNQNLSYEEAQKQAKEWLGTQDALHGPDQIAGGNPNHITGVGDAGVNRSIGAQWRKNIEAVDKWVEEFSKGMTDEQKATTHLNIRLILKE